MNITTTWYATILRLQAISEHVIPSTFDFWYLRTVVATSYI